MRLEIAVALVDVSGDTNGDHLIDRNVDRRFAANGIVVAILEFAVTFECADHRLFRDDVNCTASGRAPVERPLWPAQHFDPIDVEIGKALFLAATDERAIDVVGNAKFTLAGLVGRGDAANADVCTKPTGADAQSRDQVLQIGDVVHTNRFQIATTHD